VRGAPARVGGRFCIESSSGSAGPARGTRSSSITTGLSRQISLQFLWRDGRLGFLSHSSHRQSRRASTSIRMSPCQRNSAATTSVHRTARVNVHWWRCAAGAGPARGQGAIEEHVPLLLASQQGRNGSPCRGSGLASLCSGWADGLVHRCRALGRDYLRPSARSPDATRAQITTARHGTARGTTRVNRTGRNRSGYRGNRWNRTGLVPVPAGFKPMEFKMLNLNSKKKILQKSLKILQVAMDAMV
jgi:hypothetical protein